MNPINTFCIRASQALSLTQITLADRVINPYRGCQIGCVYCYARSNKSLQKIKKTWGEFVEVKENLPELLEAELKRSQGIRRVLIGSTTEPFQPAEKQYHLTAKSLDILAAHGIPVTVLTKSPLAAEALTRLSYSPDNTVYFTVNSEIVRKLFEKDSSSQSKRISAAKKMISHGIHVIIYISPILPGLTGIPELFEELAGIATEIEMEAYNPRLGNWEELKLKIPESLLPDYEKVFGSPDTYRAYWRDFHEKTNQLNGRFGYKLKYHIPGFDSFYQN